MHRRSAPKEQKPEMTPMIDVTFLLLIFFIVTLNFRTLEGRLDSAMPKQRGPGPRMVDEEVKLDIVLRVLVPGERVVDTTAPRYFHFEGRQLAYELGARRFLSLDALGAELAKSPLDTAVSIDARAGTIYSDVVGLLDTVIATGFEEIAFAAMREEC